MEDVQLSRLLAELALSRGDGRYVRRLAQLAKIGVLVEAESFEAFGQLLISKLIKEIAQAPSHRGRG